MSQPKPKAYIAGPWGFAESTKQYYYDVFLPLVSKYVDVIDPWAVDTVKIINAKASERPKLWLELGEQHLETIKNKADLVIACLDQEPPDNGTVTEIAWAAAYNIPVISYRNDVRTSGESGLPYNLMIEAAIRKSGGKAVATIYELEKELKRRTK